MQTKHLKFIGVFIAITSLFGSCSSPLKLGKKNVEKANYHTAIRYFEDALAKGGSNAQINGYIAEAYRHSNRLAEAEPYYKAALDANSNNDDIRFYYGYALKANKKYKEAEKYFDRYIKSGGTKIVQAKKEIKNLQKTEKLLNKKTYFEIQNCHGLNTSASEFAPVIYENKLLFSSTRKDGVFEGNGQGFCGIYEYDFKDMEKCSGLPKLYDETLTLPAANEASPAFSHDGSFVIFARSSTGEKGESDEVHLYISYKEEEGGWSEPQILPYPINISESLYMQGGIEELSGSRGDYWTSCPSITPDGKRLYFASNREGGYGGTDIWRADIVGAKLKNVRNAGRTVNTPGDELFPFVSDEGILYFASTGHPGLGGLDIFEAERRGGKTRITNLATPINSEADDFAFIYNEDKKGGFFSSNRKGGKGEDDIYQFKDNTPETKKVNYFLAMDIVGVDPSDSTKTEIVLANADVEFYLGTETKKEEKLHTFKANEKGQVDAFPILLHKDYVIIARAGNEYFKKEVEYNTYGKAIPQDVLLQYEAHEIDTTLYTKVILEKIVISTGEKQVGYEIEINFDFNKSDIRTDAAHELDKFVIFLQENPQIEIELGSHTDAVGDNYRNLILSESRAKSTYEYLVSKGIDTNRLTYKGYGETSLKVDTQEANELNRRTEFRITNIRK